MRRVLDISLLLVVGLIVTQNMVAYQAKPKLYSDVVQVPKREFALLLGTAKYKVGGGENYFYTYRIRATVALYKAKKIKKILISGDGSGAYYDEPKAMRKDLIKAGIPSSAITIDIFGVRTFDSIVRAKALFGLEHYTIISQTFHLERALFIAKAKGQDAIGFSAKDIPNTPTAYKMQAREYLARAKAILDLYVLDTKPKFDGKSE